MPKTETPAPEADVVARRLESADVLVDAQHRPHWLQETIDLAAATIRALRAERLPEGWRDISSAQKDMRERVDLWVVQPNGEGWRIPNCRHDPRSDSWIGPEGHWVQGRRFHDPEDGEQCFDPADKSPEAALATHWMPLPAPPPATSSAQLGKESEMRPLNLDKLYQDMVSGSPQLARGEVWCRSCGASRKVDSAHCLRHGWPKCCGFTMTLDAPEDQP